MKALNDIMYLIKPGKETLDKDGFPTGDSEDLKEEVFCGVKSATRSEFYNAMRDGIKVSLVFTVVCDDYGNQKLLEYNDSRYKVERIYRTGEYYVELTCSEVE